MPRHREPDDPACIGCGCTEREPCEPPCGWSQDHSLLCTRCEEIVSNVMADYFPMGLQELKRALKRATKRA